MIQVQAEAGEILQAQVAIAIDRGILEPFGEIGRLTGVGREQIRHRIESDLLHRLRDRRVLGTLQPLLQRGDVDSSGFDLSEQHEIVALTVVRVAPHDTVWKGLEKRADLALHRIGVAFVELHEQRDDAAGIQMLLDRVEELLRIKHRSPLHPRIQWIGGEGFELLLRCENVVPRVVELHVHLWIADDVEIVLAEVRRDDARHERFDLGDGHAFHRRVDRDRPGRDAGAAPDHDDRPWMGRHERREMPEHPLQSHVLRLARGLDLSRVVVIERTAHTRHRHRRHQTLPHVDDLRRLGDSRRREPAVGDEQPRHSVNPSHEKGPAPHRDDEHNRPGELESAARPSIADELRPQHQQARDAADGDEQLLGVLASDPGDEKEARPERADDGSDGVGGVHTADKLRRILSGRRHRSEGQRKTRAPEDRGRQNRPQTADHIELQIDPRVARQGGIDRPVGQRLGEHVGGPCHGAAQQQLAPPEGDAGPPHRACERRSPAAADPQTHQKHRQDQ